MQLLQLLCRLFSCSLSIEKNFNQSMWCVVSSFFLCFFFAFLFSSSDLKWFFINGCITGRNVVMNLDVTSWQMSHIHSTQYLKQATKIIMEYTIYIYWFAQIEFKNSLSIWNVEQSEYGTHMSMYTIHTLRVFDEYVFSMRLRNIFSTVHFSLYLFHSVFFFVVVLFLDGHWIGSREAIHLKIRTHWK